ncbi:MAG TPA: extracellular metalloproteinase [Blastocatellia bacterium]|nr:extracellular metalloproteinase [Blastocatellia bacterium]
MRNPQYSLLAAAMILALTLQPFSTSASNQSPVGQLPVESAIWQPQSAALPNYDIREEVGAARTSGLSQLGAAIGAVDLAKRQQAIESFKAELSSGPGDNLWVVMNEAGVPKMMFNTEGPLSFPQAGTPDSIARNFLANHAEIFGPATGMRVMNEDNDQGTTFMNYEQTLNGIPVFQGQIQVALTPSGQVLSVMAGMLIPEIEMETAPKLTESEGLQRAILHAGRPAPTVFTLTQDRTETVKRAAYQNPFGENRDELLSDLMIMRVGQRAVLAWHSYVDVGPNEWYEMLVDANTGSLLYRYNLYADVAQGTVFRTNGFGARALVSFVGDTTINTSAGWMGTSTITSGNNVNAYLDTDANNQPDNLNGNGLQTGHAVSATQNFTFPFSLTVDPRTQRAADVTNLFYFNNLMHDFVYRLGFTESAGNFQINNYGRGGTGNDPVRAEAQDGSGTNNANFGTPPEGSSPRMQMFIFTRTTPNRSSSIDGDVVLHEYGHGVSNRLVGGPANTSCLGGTQAGAMGEGWSDYFSATFFNSGIVGEYVINNQTRGIRRAPYTVPANAIHDSYADLGNQGFEVHSDGEVWTAALFELRQTLGAALADRLVVQGMKFTPCRPSFLNARDGILTADQNLNGGANRCTIWRVFARHGMGVSARGNNGTTHVAATDIPANCP